MKTIKSGTVAGLQIRPWSARVCIDSRKSYSASLLSPFKKNKKKINKCARAPYHMSHRAHGFVNVSNEGGDLTSEPQTLEMMVLATVASTGSYNTLILLYHCSVIS